MGFNVKHISFSGLSSVLLEDVGEREARRRVARRIRSERRAGRQVNILDRGREYEILDNDAALMVSDAAGYLKIVAPVKVGCAWCGQEFEPEERGQKVCDSSCGAAYFGYETDEECALLESDSFELV